MRFVFLQTSASQPRPHKRYRNLKTRNFEVDFYTFDRNWYSVNIPEDIPMNIMGDIEDGNYIKRLFFFMRKLRPIIQLHKENSIFYCFGQIMAFVTFIMGGKYIYEESDIMYLTYENSMKRWVMKRIDLFLQKHAIATVLTCNGFVDYLYKNKPENVFVFPNRLDSYFLNIKRPELNFKSDNGLNFAFIGLLRYPDTLIPFAKAVVSHNPHNKFHIWGDGPASMKKIVKELTNSNDRIIYHGPYRNPVDLNEIYSQIDVNFVCYDYRGRNERIAEPNKLYESAYFGKPILVSPNTYLSKIVIKWGTGFVVDCLSGKNIIKFLEDLSVEKLGTIRKNCYKLTDDDLVDKGYEMDRLLNYLSTKV